MDALLFQPSDVGDQASWSEFHFTHVCISTLQNNQLISPKCESKTTPGMSLLVFYWEIDKKWKTDLQKRKLIFLKEKCRLFNMEFIENKSNTHPLRSLQNTTWGKLYLSHFSKMMSGLSHVPLFAEYKLFPSNTALGNIL